MEAEMADNKAQSSNGTPIQTVDSVHLLTYYHTTAAVISLPHSTVCLSTHTVAREAAGGGGENGVIRS